MKFNGEVSTPEFGTVEFRTVKTVLGFPSATVLVGLVTLSCGGEAGSNKPSSPSGGCASQSECYEPSTGGSNGSGGAGVQCTDATSAGTAAPEHRFANWPMPHPAESGLPNPASYDTSQPDVVVDNVTGLMWRRELSELQTYEEAASYCGGLDLGGFCDWRLPTRIELVSLVDFTRERPAIDPVFLVPEVGLYLSSSEGPSEDSLWMVGRVNGGTATTKGGGAAHCVRTHQADQAPEPRYIFEGEGSQETVTDRGTGLVWQRRLSDETYSFADAQTYCSMVDLPGDGWRVPSVKELQTIVDETLHEPAIDTEVFPGFPPLEVNPRGHFWTSTREASYTDGAWLVRFTEGQSFQISGQVTYLIDSKLYVRCVR